MLRKEMLTIVKDMNYQGYERLRKSELEKLMGISKSKDSIQIGGEKYYLVKLAKSFIGCSGCEFQGQTTQCHTAPNCGSNGIFVKATKE